MFPWLFLLHRFAFYSYVLSEYCNSVTVNLLQCRLNLSQDLLVSVLNSATIEKLTISL